jgi:large subunit ribosomal protein L4
MEYALCNINTEEVGKITLDDDLFGQEARSDILSRVVNWQLAKRRAGTHSTKTISMVQGTTKKPWAQKGTGRARQGSLRSAQFRTGAIAFGPHPRDYGYTLPKKVKKLGLKMALSSKLKDGSIMILDELKLASSKTKDVKDILAKLDSKSVLIIDQTFEDENFVRAVGNIINVDLLPVAGLNVYDILNKDKLVLTKAAVEGIEARLR